jgi:chromosome segregation ATPase
MKKTYFMVLLLLMSQAVIVHAEVSTRDNGDSAALAKAQTMLREMATEKEAIRAEADQLKEEIAKRDKKIDELNHKIVRTKDSLKNSSETVSRYQDAVASQRERMESMRDKFHKLVDKYRELVAGLKHVEQERVGLQADAVQQSRALEECGRKNGELYQATLDMIEKYENKGIWDALLQKEPVTQLKRVEIENIVDDAKYRVDMLKVVDVGMTPEK